MPRTPPLTALATVLAALFAAAARFATADSEAEGTNLALSRPYDLSPTPSYNLCTDDGDRSQLTDGRTFGSDWRQQSTVGWRHASAPPTVRIDLGRVHAIDEIRVHGIGGGHAGVYYPAQILAMVSDDGNTYRVVRVWDRPGDDGDGARSTRGIPRVFTMDGLRTRGRYVQLTFAPNRRYMFLDEVEVLSGSHTPSEVQFDPRNAFGWNDAPIIAATVRRSGRVLAEIARFREKVDPTTMPAMGAELAELARGAEATPRFFPQEWRALSTQLGALRGRWLAKRWGRGLFWRRANPMEQARPDDVYGEPASEADEVRVELWQGEYESAAINLINASPKAATLEVFVSPLRSPGGRDLPSGETLALRQAVFVESTQSGVVGDALVRLDDGRLPVEAGGAAQLWLTVHNGRLGSGEYRFVIRVACRGAGGGNGQAGMIPGRITVHPRRFPERAALRTYNWAYLSLLGVSEASVTQVVDDLKAHYLDVYVVPARDRPKTSLSADGSLRVDFRRHDAALEQFPGAREYLFFWAYQPDRLGDHARWGPWMSPGYRAKLGEFLSAWVAHLRDRGIGYDRFAMYPFDERLDEAFLELARLIKEIDPKVRVFANSTGNERGSGLGRFTPYVDTWCLPDDAPDVDAARAALRRAGETDVRRYAAQGDAKSLSPYGYYRLQPWRAWAAGDTGAGFWTYAAGKEPGDCDGWDDFTCARGRWSVVYDGEGAPVDAAGVSFLPSRRWEAWREGVEDYEYLHTLRERIEACRRFPVAAPAGAEGAAVLEEAVSEVLAHADNPEVVYAARRRVTAAILRIDQLLRGATAEE